MDKKKLFDALYGLSAYDNGCDSGIYDEALRADVIKELKSLRLNSSSWIPKIIDEFCYKYFMSPKARSQGYGAVDVADFIKWLESVMNK